MAVEARGTRTFLTQPEALDTLAPLLNAQVRVESVVVYVMFLVGAGDCGGTCA